MLKLPPLPHPSELACRKAAWQRLIFSKVPQLIELDHDMLAYGRKCQIDAIEQCANLFPKDSQYYRNVAPRILQLLEKP